ncbi:MAG: hypothetical protein WKF57_10785 [Nakamurella sp.]
MNRIVGMVLGVILIAAGILFTLQGAGVVGGSAMSGNSTWTVLGPIVALVGLVLLLLTLRRGRNRTGSGPSVR